MVPTKIKFAESERVLCFHGPLLYEAKCIKVETGKDKVLRYYIHYNGWNKHWDEWVPESRILKYTEVGLSKQRELQRAHMVKKTSKVSKKERDRLPPLTNRPVGRPSLKSFTKPSDKSSNEKTSGEKAGNSQEKATKQSQEKGRSSIAAERAKAVTEKRSVTQTSKTATITEKSKSTSSDRKHKLAQPASGSDERSRSSTPTPMSDVQKRKRAKLDTTIESEESYITKVEVKVTIPEVLKPWLVDDWDLITRQKNLVFVPCEKTVDSILTDYLEFNSQNTDNIDAIKEVTNGIREYFNVVLGTQLLFKFERAQYGDILTDFPNKPFSSIYGATHLLRLFVRLGGMLVYTTLDEVTMPVLLGRIHDFLQYLQDNMSTLFLRSDYVIAPPDYHRRAI